MKIKKQRILVSFPSTCPMEIEQDQMMQKRLKEMMDFFEFSIKPNADFTGAVLVFEILLMIDFFLLSNRFK